MTPQEPRTVRFEEGSFLALILVVSLAFGWIVEPFFGAILWALIATILFARINDRLAIALGGRRNTASLLTLLLIIAIVIVPAIILGVMLVQEGTAFSARIQSGEIDIARLFQQLQASLPAWAAAFLRRLGLTDFAAAQEAISNGLANSFRSLAGQALQIGQSAFGFLLSLSVMLYLTFYLLRDGEKLGRRVARAAPLSVAHRRALTTQFVTVIRATIKGSIVVAIVQGLIGGLIFWALGIQGALLWAVVMAFFSLLPAIGTGLVWAPVAIYLLATGAVWQGIVLIFCGLFIIGLVDNLLRPILVGRDTRIPDYVVLISTLGGIEIFGFNGIVIGPVIAALFIAVWNILAETRHASANDAL
jgi:predicted PurR-regulated permease PerM